MRKLLLFIAVCAALLPAAAQEPQSGARLVFRNTSHDFGDIPRKGGDAVVFFEYANEGDVPLVITRVVTSCSCLKAAYPKRPLPPGGKASVRLTYEPHKAEAGVFHKVVQVYSNSSGGRELLTIRGNSIDKRKND